MAQAALLSTSFAILYLNGLVGEEAGWRTFLVRRMSWSYSRKQVSWLSSLLFALWHIPFDIIVAHLDPVNLVVNQGVRLLNGATFACFFIYSGWSLIPVVLFHTAHNFVGYDIVKPTGPFRATFDDTQGLIFVLFYVLITVAILLKVRRMAVRRNQWTTAPIEDAVGR